MCRTSRPLSRTRVLKPFSVNSLAAQPPLMPEPMTMASNCLFLMESPIQLIKGLGSFFECNGPPVPVVRNRHATMKTPRHQSIDLHLGQENRRLRTAQDSQV